MNRSLVLGLALAALLLSGCGRENPRLIDQQRAEALIATVEDIGSRTEAEDCDGAQDALVEARGQVAELPRRVDSKLKTNLKQWLDHLVEEVPKDCRPEPEKTPTPTVEEETPTPTPTPTVEEETPTPTPTPTATETPLPEPTEPTVEPPAIGGVIPDDEG